MFSKVWRKRKHAETRLLSYLFAVKTKWGEPLNNEKRIQYVNIETATRFKNTRIPLLNY